jgi:hypothetical protein
MSRSPARFALRLPFRINTPPAQADSPAPLAAGHGEATQEMRDARATGPRNEIDISTRRKRLNGFSYIKRCQRRPEREPRWLWVVFGPRRTTAHRARAGTVKGVKPPGLYSQAAAATTRLPEQHPYTARAAPTGDLRSLQTNCTGYGQHGSFP